MSYRWRRDVSLPNVGRQVGNAVYYASIQAEDDFEPA